MRRFGCSCLVQVRCGWAQAAAPAPAQATAVTRHARAQRLAPLSDAAQGAGGRVDVLIANAGVLLDAPLVGGGPPGLVAHLRGQPAGHPRLREGLPARHAAARPGHHHLHEQYVPAAHQHRPARARLTVADVCTRLKGPRQCQRTRGRAAGAGPERAALGRHRAKAHLDHRAASRSCQRSWTSGCRLQRWQAQHSSSAAQQLVWLLERRLALRPSAVACRHAGHSRAPRRVRLRHQQDGHRQASGRASGLQALSQGLRGDGQVHPGW